MRILHWFTIDWFTYRKANAILSEKISDSEEPDKFNIESQKLAKILRKIEDDDVRRHQDNQVKRLKSIEDKAKTNLLAVPLVVTVLYSGLELASGSEYATWIPEWVRIVSLMLSGLAVIYFLVGGAMALKVLEPWKWYTPSLRDEAAHKAKMRKVMASWAIEQNENTMLMRQNALNVSYYGIRNGAIFLAVAGAVLACSYLFA